MPATSGRRWLPLALAALLAACSHNPAPDGWLKPAREAQDDPYGAWIVISPLGDGPKLQGEFLAVEPDSVFVLSTGGDVQTIPRDSVARAQVAFYDSQWGNLAIWTTVGTLSTISNGWFLGFTFPLWTIGGSLATSSQSRAPLVWVDSTGAWDGVRMYARFPGGLPANLPRTLSPKPSPRPQR